MDTDRLVQFMRKLPLFSAYADDDVNALADAAQIQSLKAGQLVFSQGDAAETFYLVHAGRVRILLKNEDGQEVNLGVMTRGDHFGETGLITGAPRNATARAVEDSVLVAIDKPSFDRYVLSSPAQREYFDRFIQVTSIHRFLKSCTDLSVMPAKELREVVLSFQPEYFRAGAAVFRQGAEADRFYLIERGKIKVVRWEEGEPQVINVLRDGDLFGEKAILEEAPRHADIVCLTDCYLFSLSREAFDALTATSARFKKVIEDRVRSYQADRPPIPYEEVIKQELAAEKAITVEEAPAKAEIPPQAEEKDRFGGLAAFYRQRLRFPFIMQPDQMACGTTCIMMIARYYGKSFSSSRLRELAHVDRSGASLADLADAAEQVGFSTRAARLDYDALRSSRLPCIAHWQGYHFVVVNKVSAKHVWVADPARGVRKYTRKHFCENWNGITLLMEPTPKFEEQKEDRSSLRNFVQFLAPYKLILLEVVLASLLLNLFGLATPIFTQNVIDKVLAHHNPSMLNIMLLGMLLVLFFRVLVGVVRQYLVVHTSIKIDLRMLVAFYKHLLALPLGYFKVRKLGDFMARFGENRKIRHFLASTALTLVLDTMLIVVYVSLMCYYNLKMTGLAVVFIPMFAVLGFAFTPALRRLNVDSFAAHAESGSHLIESIGGIETVKALSVEHATRWKWEEKFIKCLNIDFKLSKTAFYFHTGGDFVGALGSTVVLWYGALQVMQGALSVGELMAFMALMGSVLAPANRIIAAWDEIQQTLVSVDRLNDVFSARPEIPQDMTDAKGLVLREPKGRIVFDKVFFRYGGKDDAYILSNIDMTIEPGQTVALVGRSGSGKSTLVRLIARLYDVTEGKILIDGFDIRNLHLPALRRMVGYVLQESFVFNGTVRENVSLSDPEETTERVIEAARLANAHDFISDLPQGYQTRVGESGLQLSGGQKQRIAIARALYSDPKILILDEATNSLDTESEQAIQKNMGAIQSDRTTVIIAHRLSTVRNADRILVLDNGEIVEQGTHEDLMDRRGLYHYLNHQQFSL